MIAIGFILTSISWLLIQIANPKKTSEFNVAVLAISFGLGVAFILFGIAKYLWKAFP